MNIRSPSALKEKLRSEPETQIQRAGTRVGSAYTVEWIQRTEELAALQAEWQNLTADLPDLSIFLTWEWITTWWRHFGPGSDLFLLTARDEQKRLVGIAPWMRTQQGQGPFALRRLHFIVFRLRAHLDIVARPEDKAAVGRAFAAFLADHADQWDVLDLEWLASDSLFAEQLTAAGGRCYELDSLPCSSIALPESWDSYEKSVLSANRRQQVRRQLRKLEKAHPGQVTFHRVASAEELPAILAQTAALSLHRWHAKNRTSHFDDERFVSFSHEITALALRRGWLRFYLLKVGDQIISVRYAFLYRGVFYDYLPIFDLAWEEYGPGQLLLAHTIQEAIREGAHTLEFLGWLSWKDSWATEKGANAHLLYSRGWRGNLWSLNKNLRRNAIAAGKRLPQPVQERIGQLLSLRG
jgi:CelD/BcsL family acetyltransferase involved in cellulose biosynthesis